MAESAAIDGAQVLERLGQGETLGQIVGMGPAQRDVIYNHAHALFERGLYVEAERLFATLSLLEHSTARSWLGMGACRLHRRVYNAALAAYRMALELAEDPRAALHYAECALVLGRDEDAKIALNLAIRWSNRPDSEAVRRRAEALSDGLARRLSEATPARS
jgi:type III secretion system low calcium response chaperone LcrH/SycD